jgi:hypothetical protein
LTAVSVLSAKCPRCGGVVRKDGGSDDARQRYRCPACRWRGVAAVGAEEEKSKGIDRQATARFRATMGGKRRRYVITAAQNATPVNKAFLASLLNYCKDRKAQLVVVPYRYRNPTAIWSADAEHDDWWAPEIAPYLLDRRVQLNPNLVLLADIKTQPTAVAPLQGFETITGALSGIIAHPKIAFTAIPTPQAKLPKVLTTTGAVTQKNYLPSKAGKKAEHHHSFGACVVEVDGRKFHLRQINATRDGAFMDLDCEYSGAKIRRGIRAAGLVMGDSHVEFIDPLVVKATFGGKGSIVDVLKPEVLVWHDVHDFYARNHHHRGEVFTNYVKHHEGRDNVERWLKDTFAFIDKVTPANAKNVLVASNHPDALTRWVKEADPKSDPENCVFWAQTFQAMLAGSKWADTGARTIDPFAYWGKKWLKCASRTAFLGRGDSYSIRGIDVSHHFDKGANGARGSRQQFARIGTKTVGGHSHSPGITDGAYQVGTNSRLHLEYNSGLSSWLHTDCVIYQNGKRSLLTIIDGEWRA